MTSVEVGAKTQRLTLSQDSFTPPKIGLALGGGGARGLAHIAVLEAFDELGLKPDFIAGTSIGALIGAAYASGMAASDIRVYCDALLAKRSAVLRHIYSRWRGRLWDYWNPRTSSIFNAERMLALILPSELPSEFEGLQIPLQTVAADFYTQSEHVSAKGRLLPALAASSALPALFTPVELDGRVLIDGGFANPLPFDLLRPRASFIVAVDVTGGPGEARSSLPRMMEVILGAQQIALRSIINEKLKASAPDVLIRPKVGLFRVMDFLRKDEILAAAVPAKLEVKHALEELHRHQVSIL